MSGVAARLAEFRASLGRHGTRRLPAVPRLRLLTRLPISPHSLGGSVLRIVVVAGAIAVTMAVAVTAFTYFYDQYGFHPEKNAAAWARLSPQYADSSDCRACHADLYATWALSQHYGVACESCHGPLAAHVTAASAGAAGAVLVTAPSTEICARCHEKVEARPSAFPQEGLAAHYDLASCGLCHDPHSTQGTNPPAVAHRLASLPDCIACHGTQGLKPFPAGHRESSDAVCLRCHAVEQPPS